MGRGCWKAGLSASMFSKRLIRSLEQLRDATRGLEGDETTLIIVRSASRCATAARRLAWMCVASRDLLSINHTVTSYRSAQQVARADFECELGDGAEQSMCTSVNGLSCGGALSRDSYRCQNDVAAGDDPYEALEGDERSGEASEPSPSAVRTRRASARPDARARHFDNVTFSS